ncbi:hypothetical protein ACQQ2Q_03565 [Agrobacterium sp. ES01]|uniref:hypothetical protein n=1 Tax=Agrobacterium sp. ES01 TaxID=3420714 RepID=UPI003D09F567
MDNNDRDMMKELKKLQDQVSHYREMLGDEGRNVAEGARARGAQALEVTSAKARDAARYARNEAGGAAAMAREYPTATSTALLTVGLIGGVVGYLIGQSQTTERDTRWRWH